MFHMVSPSLVKTFDAEITAASSSPAGRWATQEEAATLLGVTTRTIRRLAADRKVASCLKPAPGRKPLVLIDPQDIRRLLEERNRGVVMPPSPDIAGNPGGLTGKPFEEVMNHVADQIAGAVRSLAAPAPVKPWLTLDEAAEYSGLPKSYLLTLAGGGCDLARNVGSDKHRVWRFNRDALSR